MNILKNSVFILITTSFIGICLSSFAEDNACKNYIETYIISSSAAFDKLLKDTDSAHLLYFKKLVSNCEITNACQQMASGAMCASQLASQNFQLSLASRDKASHSSSAGFFPDSRSISKGTYSFSSPPQKSQLSSTEIPDKSKTNSSPPGDSSVNWF